MKISRLALIALLLVVPALLYGRWIEDRVAIDTDGFGDVPFSHFNHLEAVGKNCPTCHNELFHVVTEKNPHVTMAEMEEGKSCGSCHNGKKAFSVSGDCGTCHAIPELFIESKGAGKTPFSHEIHTAMFACGDCHEGIYRPAAGQNPHVTMAQMEQGESCGMCHDGSTAFGVDDNCTVCHQTREIEIESITGGKTLFSHEIHTAMFGCDACHPDLFVPVEGQNPHVTMAQMEEGTSCGACHDGSTAFGVDGNCTICHETREIAFHIPAAGKLVFSHEIHTAMFDCTDCHAGLFTVGTSKTMAQMEQGESCGGCHDGDTAFSVGDNCTACHETREIAMQTPGAGEATFSHEIHTAMFGCSDCHPDLFVPDMNRNPAATMADMEGGMSCGACHDGDTAFGVQEDCSTCHPTREITFKTPGAGKALFSHEIHTAMFGCSDCHPGLFVAKQGANRTVTMAQMGDGESCGACHDGDTAFGVQDDCSSCHPTREITFETPGIGDAHFSHDVHTSMFECQECHPDIFQPGEDQRFTMEEMKQGLSCGACHDGNTAFGVQECGFCHQ